MTQEEKDLLLKDLSARLPYGVKGIEANTLSLLNTSTHFKSLIKNIEYKINYLGFKPYLFPLSSMTEEQKQECFKGTPLEIDKYGDIAVKDDLSGNSHYTDLEIYLEVIDWLNKNHFDFRNLIGRGLAIDATGLNIYINKNIL